jgi:hypothetical protein
MYGGDSFHLFHPTLNAKVALGTQFAPNVYSFYLETFIAVSSAYQTVALILRIVVLHLALASVRHALSLTLIRNR